jgi:hypothetical protein
VQLDLSVADLLLLVEFPLLRSSAGARKAMLSSSNAPGTENKILKMQKKPFNVINLGLTISETLTE